MRKQLTIAITGEQGAGKTLLAKALARLLENRGLFCVEESGGRGNNGYFDLLTFEVDSDARHVLAALGSEIEKAPVLDLAVPDVYGNRPPQDLIGRTFRHVGNHKVYEVLDFVWMGEDDVWGFLHREVGNPTGVSLVRPLAHLTGKRTTGELRYEEVVRNPFNPFLVEAPGLEFLPPSITDFLRTLVDAPLTSVVVRDRNRIEAHYVDRPGHVVLETNAEFDVSEERRLREIAPDLDAMLGTMEAGEA